MLTAAVDADADADEDADAADNDSDGSPRDGDNAAGADIGRRTAEDVGEAKSVLLNTVLFVCLLALCTADLQ